MLGAGRALRADPGQTATVDPGRRAGQRLDGGRVEAGVAQNELIDNIAVGPILLVHWLLGPGQRHVGRGRGVKQQRVGPTFLQIENDRQASIVNDDEFCGIDGSCSGLGQYQRDRLTHESHCVDSQHRAPHFAIHRR